MRQTITISLDAEMRRKTEQLAKVEHRTTSELVREALRNYFEKAARFPTVEATPAEVRALKRGRKQIAEGNFVTLDQLKHELAKLDAPSKSRRAQKSPTRTSA